MGLKESLRKQRTQQIPPVGTLHCQFSWLAVGRPDWPLEATPASGSFNLETLSFRQLLASRSSIRIRIVSRTVAHLRMFSTFASKYLSSSK